MAQNAGPSWKRRPSEIRGYQRALYATDDNGNYIRADYNLKEKKIRLYVELTDEGGAAYYAVIQNGDIAAERSVQSGRAGKFSNKFSDLAHVFSTIPNREVLDLINKRYGIVRGLAKRSVPDSARGISLDETREKYFKNSDINPYVSESRRERISFVAGFSLVDAVDVGAALLVLGAVLYFSNFNIALVGIIASLAGLLMGILDMFIREKNPVFIKVLLFFFSGVFVYLYGYYIY